LEISPDTETLSLIGEKGETLVTMSWGTLIHCMSTSVKEVASETTRNYPRVHLAVKVKYQTPDNRLFETLTGNISGGGVFIEHSPPLQVGTTLVLNLFLPDGRSEPVQTEGHVAWVRPERICRGLEVGMGVRFTDMSETARNRLVRMVTSLEQARQGT
jgi:uncharacterized protein (TIGR02266 family)